MDPKESYFKISASFKDGTTIEEKDFSILNNIYFEKKLLETINADIEDKSYTNNASNFISNKYYSTISIKTNDGNFFDAVCHSIEENLNSMAKQNRIYILGDRY